MYKVMCTIGDCESIVADTMEKEFSGIPYKTWEEAKRELDEAAEHPAVYSAWIDCIERGADHD